MLFHYLGGETGIGFDKQYVTERAQAISEEAADIWKLIEMAAGREKTPAFPPICAMLHVCSIRRYNLMMYTYKRNWILLPAGPIPNWQFPWFRRNYE